MPFAYCITALSLAHFPSLPPTARHEKLAIGDPRNILSTPFGMKFTGGKEYFDIWKFNDIYKVNDIKVAYTNPKVRFARASRPGTDAVPMMRCS